MVDAGIVLMESSNNDIHDNVVDGARYGIRLVTGANNNEVYDNEFNDISDGEAYESCLTEGQNGLRMCRERLI